MIAHADGRALHELAPHGYCGHWSPSGSEIVYVDNRGYNLRAIAPSSGRVRTLVAKGGICGVSPPYLQWAPNGKAIAEMHLHGLELSIIGSATGRVHTIAAFKDVDSFAWSPDSTQLLVAARATPSGCSSIWRIDADGANRKLIARC
jgi:Tol biopolymer transport system component